MTHTAKPNYKELLIRKSVYLFLGKAMPVIILFLITIFYSRKLSYGDYGTFQSVWMYANIVNVIISFGVSSVILSTDLNFLFAFIKRNKNIIAPFYIILSLAVLTAFFFFAKNFTVTIKFLLIAFIIIQNLVTIAETLLIKQGGEKNAFIINFFYAMLFFAWHLYILYSGYSLVFLITGISVISVIKFLAVILFHIIINKGYKPVNDNADFINHWISLGVNEILGIIAKWIDKIFLLYLLTSSDFAVFFNGSFEIPLFGLLISVTGSFLLIEISSNTKMSQRIIDLFRENFNMLSSIVFPLFFFFLFFRDELFSLVFKNKYNDSIPIFLISIFVLPIRINNYSVILQCLSKGKKILLGSLIDILLAIILMISLYPVMGTRGIALAIVIATWFQVIFYLWQSAVALNISVTQLIPLKKLAMKFLILLAFYVLLSLTLQHPSKIINVVIAATFTTAAVVAGMWSYLKSLFNSNYGKVS
ncbi:MAG: hypothetical protein ABIO76_02895 [Ginsengibacter sp.]